MSETIVPNIFIDKYLASAKGSHIAVYLYGLRWRESSPSLAKIAGDLGLSETDVTEALTFWQNAELSPPAEIALEVAEVAEVAEPKAAKRVKKLPAYSVQDIERAAVDTNYMFKMAERILGRPLTYSDMSLLMGFCDHLALPVSVIEVLLDYCVSNDRKNRRYMETVAINWADSGINTVVEAEAHIKAFNGDYREILRAMGQSGRDPVQREMAYMRKWLRDYKFSMEMILEACDRTVFKTGRTSFSYTDRIITTWNDKNIRTLAAAKADEEAFQNSHKKPRAKAVKSRFANYKGREWNFDELEKLAAESVDKEAR